MINEAKKIYSLLGLAAKAGYVASGEFMSEKMVKEGKAYVVIVAGDASDNTKKNFNDMCSFYHVPIYIFGDKENMGHSIGKELRASLTIQNQGMAQAIMKQLSIYSERD